MTGTAHGLDREHDPGVAEARERADALAGHTRARVHLAHATVLFGTAGWTDPTLTAPGVFYPDAVKSPEARLRFYATRFPLVEVDSAYYALPARRNAELWVERTPDDFTFDVKAFALMTGHASEVDRLPAALKREIPPAVAAGRRVYAKDLPPALRDEVWRLFADAVEPLAEAGKLGAILLQYPPWVRPAAHAADMLERARERLGDLPIAVEFRHRDWLAPGTRERTLALLREHDMSYVVVDEPQGLTSSVPPDLLVTTRALAVVRLHGRRLDTWEKRGATVEEKYRYLYDSAELAPWAARIRALTDEAERVHVVFNNCYGNYGTTNALEMASLVGAERAD